MMELLDPSLIDARVALLSIMVVFAYAIGATTGFGASIITVTLAVHLYPIDVFVPVIVPVNVIVTVYMSARHREHVNAELLFRRMLPLAGAGLPLGMALFYLIDASGLKWMFGAFVILIASFELVRLFREQQGRRPLAAASGWWLLAGGLIHGLWVSGGPLVVYWAGRSLKTKAAFRATLIALWLLLNVSVMLVHLAAGRLNMQTLALSAAMLPPMALGVAAGEWLHERLAEGPFRILVYVVLILSGLSILVKT